MRDLGEGQFGKVMLMKAMVRFSHSIANPPSTRSIYGLSGKCSLGVCVCLSVCLPVCLIYIEAGTYHSFNLQSYLNQNNVIVSICLSYPEHCGLFW